MCGEMLKDPTAPEVRLYAKTLSNLELSRDETVRKDLQMLLQQLVQVHADLTEAVHSDGLSQMLTSAC